MKSSRLIGWLPVLALAAAAGSSPAFAATLTVSPDGTGDYQTIQDAVDAAAAGDTVYIRNGIYETGGRTDNFSTRMANRVFVNKSISLVGENREKTIIKGAHAKTPEDAYGLGVGSDAVRCIGIGADNVVISNLTVTGGSTHKPAANDDCDGNGGGIYVSREYNGVQVVDCIISNNVANRAAGIRHGSDMPSQFSHCLVVRCWLDGNKTSNTHPVGRGCLFAHCLITRHFSTSTVDDYATFVNCTIADGNLRCFGGSQNFSAYNCLFADNWYKCDYACSYYNCTFSSISAGIVYKTSDLVVDNCQVGTDSKGVGFDHFVAPLLLDYRLHNHAQYAVNAGNAAYLEQIPEAFRYTDFYGRAFTPADGKVNVGCSQEVVTPVGGKVVFSGFDDVSSAGMHGYTMSQTNDYCFGEGKHVVAQMKQLGYFYADVWPKSAKLQVELRDARWAGLYGFKATGADTVWRHAYLDDTYEFCAPKDPAAVLTLTPIKASSVVYVKQSSTVMPQAGTEAAPYTDLQTAIDAVPADSYSIIKVDGGMFTTGSTTSENLANRVVVPDTKYVHLIGVGGPARNIIVGARDTTAEAVDGMGANAIRALRISRDSVVQGFTLTGGASHYSDNVGLGKRGAGVWLGKGAQALDCVISNNVGRQGAAINSEESGMNVTAHAFRCVIADNKSLNIDGTAGGSGLVRSTTTASCLYHENYGAMYGSYENVAGHFNTYGESKSTSSYLSPILTLYSSIVYAPNATVNRTLMYGGVVKFGAGLLNPDSTGHSTAPALLANPAKCDYRVGTVSPAITSVAWADDSYIYLTRDVSGKPFRFTNGLPLCGAVQDFAPTIVSDADGISPSGTNVVTGSSVTYTATKAETRPFLGFEINGVTQEVVGATYEYTLPTFADWQGVVLSVKAIYDTNWYVDPAGDDSARGTAAHPKRTLKGGLMNAISGDTVHVAAGIYDTLTMQQTNQLGNISGAYDHEARAVVPEGVALVGAGAEITFIVGANDSGDPDGTSATLGCGPTAVRCVALNAGASLSGFTLTGGRTDADGNADNFFGGGVLASCVQSSLPTISDCIISNCVGRRGGGGTFGNYNRCKFLRNVVIGGGNGSALRGSGDNTAFIRNSIVDDNTGWATLYMVTDVASCTIGAGNKHENGAVDGASVIVDCPSVRNVLLTGSSTVGGNTALWRCAYGPGTRAYIIKNTTVTTNDNCIEAASLNDLSIDLATYMPIVDANIAIDAANAEYYDSGDMDCLGKKRLVNGKKLDIGAVEADWLDAYSKAIGRWVRVTAADGAVERIDGKVTIPPGAMLAAMIGRGGKDRKYRLGATVVADSQCTVVQDGVPWAQPLIGRSETRFTAANDRTELIFAARGSGVTVLDYLCSVYGMFMVIK